MAYGVFQAPPHSPAPPFPHYTSAPVLTATEFRVNQLRIAFIGAGNMASSIIGGLLAEGVPAGQLHASDPSPEMRARAAALGVQATDNNAVAVKDADIVVLAVKPQVMKDVLQPLAGVLAARRPLVVSIAAGITIANLQDWLGQNTAVVRCMPNTPALVRLGATGLFANEHVSAAQRAQADALLKAVGTALWVDSEAQLDAVTALSGSGPAYFFLVIEAMIEAGIQLGLPPETARALTLQTALGSARMAVDSDVDAAELRRRVTSPGGTTAEAIRTFEEGGLRTLFLQALQAAERRSRELAAQ